MTGGKSRGSLRVLAVCALPDEVVRLLKSRFRVAALGAAQHAAGDLAVALAASDADVLLISVETPLPAERIAALPRGLRAIATYSVGHEHIDLHAARARGLAVFHTPGALTDSVAEIGILLLLAAARRVAESTALIRSRAWAGWSAVQLNGMELSGKTLGIVGMGCIGQGIAARARAFGMGIHYCNRRRLPPPQEVGATFHATPDALLPLCDALALAAPSTNETRGFLNAERIAKLKRGAIVVNVARGDLVDDGALIGALGEGRIGAAGLDVFNGEPALDPRYFDLPNVYMLPHIGSSTIEARLRMGRCLVDALALWSEGGAPSNRLV